MPKKSKDAFLQNLRRRQEQATAPAEATTPEQPEPAGPLPSDPEVRSEYLSDELRDAREELGRERAKRQHAEQRLQQQARPGSLSALLRERQRGKRRTWR